MGHEGAVSLDPVVELREPPAVAVDGEAGDDPDDLAEEVDDGGDVGELHPESGLVEPDQLQSGGRSGSGGPPRAAGPS